MALPNVSQGQPHVQAHNDERALINAHEAQLAGLTLWQGTQAAYDAIATKSATTIYFIKAS